MKKRLGQIKEYWKKLMNSTHVKLSEGAQEISRIITSARRDNWRRKDKVQRGHEQHTKHHHHDRK